MPESLDQRILWRAHARPRARETNNTHLLERGRPHHQDSNGVMGESGMHETLASEGTAASFNRIARLMAADGLAGVR